MKLSTETYGEALRIRKFPATGKDSNGEQAEGTLIILVWICRRGWRSSHLARGEMPGFK